MCSRALRRILCIAWPNCCCITGSLSTLLPRPDIQVYVLGLRRRKRFTRRLRETAAFQSAPAREITDEELDARVSGFRIETADAPIGPRRLPPP